MQHWLMEQTGGVQLRILTGTVATVRIGATDAQIAAHGAHVRDRVEQLLRQEGYADPYRLYAVWYDGTSTFSCGGGAWPPDLPGQVAALSLQGRYDGVDRSLDRFSGDGTTVEISAPHHYLTGRADIPDLSRSVFLDPLPADPLPPPGW